MNFRQKQIKMANQHLKTAFAATLSSFLCVTSGVNGDSRRFTAATTTVHYESTNYDKPPQSSETDKEEETETLNDKRERKGLIEGKRGMYGDVFIGLNYFPAKLKERQIQRKVDNGDWTEEDVDDYISIAEEAKRQYLGNIYLFSAVLALLGVGDCYFGWQMIQRHLNIGEYSFGLKPGEILGEFQIVEVDTAAVVDAPDMAFVRKWQKRPDGDREYCLTTTDAFIEKQAFWWVSSKHLRRFYPGKTKEEAQKGCMVASVLTMLAVASGIYAYTYYTSFNELIDTAENVLAGMHMTL